MDTFRQFKTLPAFGAGGLVLLLGLWAGWAFFRTPTIDTYDGRTVRDVPAREAREMSGSDSADIRRRYLTNLEIYKTLPIRKVGVDPAVNADAVADILARGLVADERNREVLDVLPDHAWRAFGHDLALWLARMAGLPEDVYLASLPPGTVMRGPVNAGMIGYMEETYNLRTEVNFWQDDLTDAEMRRLFSDLYRLGVEYDGGGTLITGVAEADAGLRLAVRFAQAAEPFPDVLQPRLTPQEQTFFLGGLVQGYLQFTGTAADSGPSATSRRAWANLAFIVENKAGDRYPVWFLADYDPSSGRWRLRNVMRTTSVRATGTPAFVF